MKLSGNHTSLIDLSQEVLQYLEPRLIDLKVSPGIIISKRSAKARNHKIKLRERHFGFDVTVTQNATIQKLRIYSDKKLEVIEHIKCFCQANELQFSKN